jgi:hypothetical protein
MATYSSSSARQTDTTGASGQADIYAVSARWARGETAGQLDTWAQPLETGQPLPTLPLWLTPTLALHPELEAAYETTLRTLRIS